MKRKYGYWYNVRAIYRARKIFSKPDTPHFTLLDVLWFCWRKRKELRLAHEQLSRQETESR